MNNSEGFVLEDIKLTRYSYPTRGTQPKVQYLLAKEGTYIWTERGVFRRRRKVPKAHAERREDVSGRRCKWKAVAKLHALYHSVHFLISENVYTSGSFFILFQS